MAHEDGVQGFVGPPHLQQAPGQSMDIQMAMGFGGDDLKEFGRLQLDGDAIEGQNMLKLNVLGGTCPISSGGRKGTSYKKSFT